jgi:hypothetical protein
VARDWADRPRQVRLWPLTRRPALVLAVLLLAGWHQLHLPPRAYLIEPEHNVDSFMKLQGIERDARLRDALHYFIGDDPQRVHTFRPLPALMLWFEYQCWGYRGWPYVVINWLWFIATGYAVFLLARAMRIPRVGALVAGAAMVADVTRGTKHVIPLAAARHDLVCVFFAVLALYFLWRFLRLPRPLSLIWFGLCLLLAYLSKEMALALLPVCLGVAACAWRRPAARRHAVSAAAVTALIALVWFVWYGLAQRNMGPEAPTHGFASWLSLLRERWPISLDIALFHLSRPVGHLKAMLSCHSGWTLILYPLFWQAILCLALQVACVVLLWKHQRQWLGMIYLWKVMTWLPVLPFNACWAWYEYMPHVLDPLLGVGAVCVLWRYRSRWRGLLNWTPRTAEAKPWAS